MMMSFRSSHICAKRSFHCLFSSSVNCVPRIVFENNHALIIDKPAGISHHSSGEENGIMKNMRVLQKSDPSIYGGDLFSVHRLDRDTSGLLLFAKTKFAASFFSKEFADRKVVKYYVAISNQKPTKKMGLISGDMAPSRRSKQKLLRTQKDPAKSRFISQSFDCGLGKVQSTDSGINTTDIEDVFAKYSTAAAPSLRAFLIRPLTGKKHQLRTMLKSLRAPALGDPLYSTKDNFDKSMSDRCYLHACALRINMPGDGGENGDRGGIVQLVLPPSQGRLFCSPGFRDCWNSWILPQMIQKEDDGSSSGFKKSGCEADLKQFSLLTESDSIKFC